MKNWVLTSASKIYLIRGNPQKVSLGMKYLSDIFISMVNELLVPKNLLSQTEVDIKQWFLGYTKHQYPILAIYRIFRRTLFPSTFPSTIHSLIKISSKFKQEFVPDMYENSRETINDTFGLKERNRKNYLYAYP